GGNKTAVVKSFKRIFNELWKFKRIFIFATVAGVISSTSYFYVSVLIKELFDALESKRTDIILSVPWAMLGLVVLYGIARYWNMYLNQYVGDCVSVSLRQRL